MIGSGATAVTLVPALAETAAHVTMLQRSPSYIVSRPSRDGIARRLQRRLPAGAADAAIRWKNVLLGMFFFSRARKQPDRVRATLLKLVAERLPPGYDIERDFAPALQSLGPARLPGARRRPVRGDHGRHGSRSSPTGSRASPRPGSGCASGEELEADIVVTATGLVVKLLGGIALAVDGAPVNVAERLSYKGMMLSDVPNLALSLRLHQRLLDAEMRPHLALRLPAAPPYGPARARHLRAAAADRRRRAPADARFQLGLRPAAPRAACRARAPKPPWRVHQNYLKDLAALRLRHGRPTGRWSSAEAG